MINPFKQAPMPKPSPTARGMAGYDNPRDNIDPFIKTKVISTIEICSGARVIGDLYIDGTGRTTNLPVNDKDIVNKLYADSENLWTLSTGSILPKNVYINLDSNSARLITNGITNDLDYLGTGDINNTGDIINIGNIDNSGIMDIGGIISLGTISGQNIICNNITFSSLSGGNIKANVISGAYIVLEDPVGAATKTIAVKFTGSGSPYGSNILFQGDNTHISDGSGGSLTFTAGNGGASVGYGGNIVFNSGTGGTAKGSINFQVGGTGLGSVFFEPTGDRAPLNTTTFGYKPSSGTGAISLKAGSASNAAGGHIYILGGTGGATGDKAGGNVYIYPGIGGGSGLSGSTIIPQGNLFVNNNISGGTLTARNGFTGTGAYTTFTISGGIVLSAS